MKLAMAKKKVKTKTPVYLKLDTDLVNKIRKNKEKTGVPINVFAEQALTEKLKSIESKS
jgi:ACT domain-containing protein